MASSSEEEPPPREEEEETLEEEALPPAVVVCSLDPSQVNLMEILEAHDSIWSAGFERLSHESLRQRRLERQLSLRLVVHVVEGRTLLVDEDGYYNEVLDGRVAIGLAGVPTADDKLARDDVVAELVDSGQSSIWRLVKEKRFFTWDTRPSALQIDRLIELIDPAAEPFEATDDMRHYSNLFDKRSASTSSSDSGFGVVSRPEVSGLRFKAIALPVLTHLTNLTTSLRNLGDACTNRPFFQGGGGGGVWNRGESPSSSQSTTTPSPTTTVGGGDRGEKNTKNSLSQIDDSDWVFDDFDDFLQQQQQPPEESDDLGCNAQDDIAV